MSLTETMATGEEPTLLSLLHVDPYINDQDHPESQPVPEEEPKHWDVFGLKTEELNDNKQDGVYRVLLQLLKVAVCFITFSVVLGSAVVSKGTILLMTSAIKEDRTFSICGKKDDIGVYRDKITVQLPVEERKAWMWSLLFVLIVPEVFMFIRSVRICIFKRNTLPNLSTFLVVLTAESCHAIGLVFMLFLVFPQMDILKALTLTNGVCIVPCLLNFLSSWNTKCRKKMAGRSTLDLIAFLSQCTSLFFYIFLAITHPNKMELWATPTSLLLISCTWWENFVNCNSIVFKRLEEIMENIDESRDFIYIFIPLWKIVLIVASFILCLFITENDIEILKSFPDYFKDMNYNTTIVSSATNSSEATVSLFTTSTGLQPIIVLCIHIASSYLCYSFGKFACKICIQGFSYALPISLAVPTAMCLLHYACTSTLWTCKFSYLLPHIFWDCPVQQFQSFFISEAGFMWILWIVSQSWLTMYIWTPKTKRMASTKELFVNPMYCTVLIDQSLALNRKNHTLNRSEHNEINDFLESGPGKSEEIEGEKSFPLILACATMWHETPDEMELLLKSIMRMDEHQCMKRAIRKELPLASSTDYYEIEAHVFFDDAFVISDEDDTRMVVNSFVKDLIATVENTARKIYPTEVFDKMEPPMKVPTPYGGRLIWKLQGENMLIVHLKNKDLIRHKKRWSQVMYMYYFLGYRLMNPDVPIYKRINLARNTYILALDGDIDFKPDAVQLLVDLMQKNENLGAACGRIHPVGTGMMVYYQMFEYAIGHWLQKATEHIIGCVLCSPGCFSLFRAESLMQDNVVRRYTTTAREAIEYVQFDQGEDRWLCTLLLQSGSRVEYSAASDAYTHCPESFAEFYTQRRRWAPSTMANIMDLLLNYKTTVECNDNISLLYIAYQCMLMVGTVLGPGTIFLMLVGAMVTALGISNWQSLIANFVPIAFFILICFVAKNDTQIMVAQIFSAAYALLMMAVLVGISLQLVTDGIASPTAIFLLSMTASFVIAAILHPQEFWCVVHGLVYFLSVPSMYLLLTLYSIINLNVVSWGTREVATKKTKKQLEQEQLQAAEAAKKMEKNGLFDWLNFLNDKKANSDEEEGSISFSLANLFRCMCCTYPKQDPTKIHLVKIGEQLERLNRQIKNLQMQIDFSVARPSGFRRRSSLHGLSRDSNLNPVSEGNEDVEEIEEEEEDDVDGEEHMYNQIASSNQVDEYWLSDPVLQKSPIYRLHPEEETFWKDLIKTYLYPLDDNPEEKAKVAAQLKDLRNKVVFGILMLNSLFILIVFLLQLQKQTLHIEWRFAGKPNITYFKGNVIIDFEYLQLEPINLVLVFFFSVIVAIQFVAMLFHRFQTMAHILASTDLNCFKKSTTPEQSERAIMAELTDRLRKLNLRPNDRVDGDMNARRRRSTIFKLDQKRQERPSRPRLSLSVAYADEIQNIMETDQQIGQQGRNVRSASLGRALRRYSLFSSRSCTPGSSITQGSWRRGMEMLDREFSNSPATTLRHSYINRGFEDDRRSISSTISRNQLNVSENRLMQRQSVSVDIHASPEA